MKKVSLNPTSSVNPLTAELTTGKACHHWLGEQKMSEKQEPRVISKHRVMRERQDCHQGPQVTHNNVVLGFASLETA
jgi:hypothetical protein